MSIIVNFTPTGMIPTKAMNPHLPVAVNEIVEDVLRAAEIGVTTVHLHARDAASGEPTYRADVYGEIITGIRAHARDLVIGVSTSGRRFETLGQRADCLQLEGAQKPDMASLTLSSVNFNAQASVNAPDMIRSLAEKMKVAGIMPELEAFDAGMINYAKYLLSHGLLRPPLYFNLILGNIACAQADLLHLGVMLRDLPPDSYWSLAGIGDSQLRMNSVAIAVGGGVRVGLEDNVWLDRSRTTLATNADLLRRVKGLVEANGDEIMDPRTFRRLLGLEDGDTGYGLKAHPSAGEA